MRKELPNVTLCIIDTLNYGDALHALSKSLKEINPHKTIFFTDIDLEFPEVEFVKIPTIHSKEEYSKWMIKEFGKHHFETSHVLVIQWDGFVLDGKAWRDDFIEWDYIGGRWWNEIDGLDNGNGGYSLRSVKLLKVLSEDEMIQGLSPEDANICRLYRSYLETNHDIKFAPSWLCDLFSFETVEPAQPTFGFHGKFHSPWRDPVVIRRTGALGDVVQLSPVLEWFHEHGHQVVLDSPFYMLYARHYFTVTNYKDFDHKRVAHKFINLDLSYEMKPKQLHLKTYFEMCGITDYKLRNPRLNYVLQEETKLFKQRYMVIHIDERETQHRNIRGVDWKLVENYLTQLGLLVVQVSKNTAPKIGIQFNAVNEPLLMWLIAGCEFMIAADSGPSNIAVALNKKAIIFFGSVNPEFIYADLSRIIYLQSECPANNQNCWHNEPGTRGSDCIVDKNLPPCVVVETGRVISAIDKIMTIQ